MDPKKNTVLAKLREKAKPLFNVKIGKKVKKTPLKYRRSISVPDLRCTKSMSSIVDSTVDSSDNDSITGPVFSLGPDEEKSDSNSLIGADIGTDTHNIAKSHKPFSTSDTTNSAKVSDQCSASYTPSPAKMLEQINAQHPPSLGNIQDNATLTDPQSVSTFSTSERPAVTDSPILRDKPDKRMAEKDRTTKWYLEDTESTCSTPFEEHSFWPTEQDQNISPVSTSMFIIGSAENTNEVSWDYILCYFDHIHNAFYFILQLTIICVHRFPTRPMTMTP